MTPSPWCSMRLAYGDGGEFRAPMATAVIGRLSSSRPCSRSSSCRRCSRCSTISAGSARRFVGRFVGETDEPEETGTVPSVPAYVVQASREESADRGGVIVEEKPAARQLDRTLLEIPAGNGDCRIFLTAGYSQSAVAGYGPPRWRSPSVGSLDLAVLGHLIGQAGRRQHVHDGP